MNSLPALLRAILAAQGGGPPAYLGSLPQAGARMVGRTSIGAGIRQFPGSTRRPRIEVLRQIVTGAAVAAEERVTFEVQKGSAWVGRSRMQLTVYFAQGGRIARELQYWAPGQ